MSNQRCKRCAVEAHHCKGTHESSTPCRRFVEVEPFKASLLRVCVYNHLKSAAKVMRAYDLKVVDII